jgi:hypothetical protein
MTALQIAGRKLRGETVCTPPKTAIKRASNAPHSRILWFLVTIYKRGKSAVVVKAYFVAGFFHKG